MKVKADLIMFADDSVHGQKSGGANGDARIGFVESRQNQTGRNRRLEERATLRPATTTHQSTGLSHYSDTIRRLR